MANFADRDQRSVMWPGYLGIRMDNLDRVDADMAGLRCAEKLIVLEIMQGETTGAKVGS